MGGMLQKQAFLADSPDSGMKYPHKVGLASHIRHGNFGEVCDEPTRVVVEAYELVEDQDGAS
jgi:hypothetical protein